MPFLRRDWLSIVGIGLLANTLAAYFIRLPGYLDAYYYFGGALQLARGHGLTEPYLWNYLAPVHVLPAPSHLYWMPLTSFVAAPFLALAGSENSNPALFRFAQIPFVLLASALPLLSYAVAARTTGLRRHALAAALLTLFSAFYFVFWTNTDAFALYGLAAGGALFASGLAVQHQSLRWFLVAGVCAGLAHLTRADGIVVLLVVLAGLLKRSAIRDSRYALRTTRYALVCLLGYLLVMLPWFLRNWLAMGTPLAPGGMRVLWLTHYDDLFNYPADTLTSARYFAQGWGAILESKGAACLTNLGTVIGPLGNIAAFPFILMGLWKLRRHPLYSLPLLYAVVLFALMTLVFTFPGARGGLFHSGAALLPFFSAAALVGLDASVDWVARRLPHWQPEKSRPVFTVLLVTLALGLTGLVFRQRVIGPDWRSPANDKRDSVYADIGQWLSNANSFSDSVVAVGNPPGFYYFTHHPSIVIPNGGPDDLFAAMRAFGAGWAVLDANYPAGLKELYAAPESDPRLRLRATFTDAADQPVYLFEIEP
jgi:4-amino-4-deoxy-L-arabinose transferase-like glycosyltransferase